MKRVDIPDGAPVVVQQRCCEIDRFEMGGFKQKG